MKTTVSIITPCYNSANFIADTITSVIEQRFMDWELIVIDDCSTDDSIRIIQEFVQKDSRVNLVKLSRNSGVSAARNSGINVARGRYIAFLDSDDIWHPCKLDRQLSFMKRGGHVFTFSAYEKVDENGKIFGHIGVPNRVSYRDLLKTNYIGCLTVMYDSRFFGKVIMPESTKREDLVTWLQLLKVAEFAYGMNEMLAQYRVHSSQSSSRKLSMARENWRVYREIEGLDLLNSIYCFINYSARGFLRTRMPRIARVFGILH